MKRDSDDNNEEGWEYGDVWKEGNPDEPAEESDIEYVDVLRGDTGRGYSDTTMLDFIGYLSSRGIRATYDAVPLAVEFGPAIKVYTLKVEAGKEAEAIRYLQEEFGIQGP